MGIKIRVMSGLTTAPTKSRKPFFSFFVVQEFISGKGIYGKLGLSCHPGLFL
jgi:hypothetical protein